MPNSSRKQHDEKDGMRLLIDEKHYKLKRGFLIRPYVVRLNLLRYIKD